MCLKLLRLINRLSCLVSEVEMSGYVLLCSFSVSSTFVMELQEYDAVYGCYCVTPELMAKAKASAVLMHPLPRVKEISEDCDLDPRAAYFRQMEVSIQ